MTTNARPWSPTGDDHLIFQWVKMEGKSQQQVASMFGINQSTISRIVQRYERWQAHLKERENGRLDRAERLRAQRWLTYERNELMLTSCLRIAQEMEGFTELSTSVTQYPTGQLCEGRKMRNEERVVDRHGVAARFLRLAYRINMEQLKLAELVEPPAAEPLTDEELAEEARQAAADAAELAAARQRVQEENDFRFGREDGETPAEPQEKQVQGSKFNVQSHEDDCAPTLNLEPGTLNSNPPTHQAPAAPPLHNVHNENAPQIAATTAQPCTCALEIRLEKNSQPCITPRALPTSPSPHVVDCDPPPWPEDALPERD